MLKRIIEMTNTVQLRGWEREGIPSTSMALCP